VDVKHFPTKFVQPAAHPNAHCPHKVARRRLVFACSDAWLVIVCVRRQMLLRCSTHVHPLCSYAAAVHRVETQVFLCFSTGGCLLQRHTALRRSPSHSITALWTQPSLQRPL